MERQRLEEEEAVRAAQDKGKNIAEEKVMESSSQKEKKQPIDQVNVENAEVNEENALVLAQLFTLVGGPKTVFYNKEDNARRIEVKRRRLKEKEYKKAHVDEKVDKENDDEDVEDDDLKDIDDFHESDDDKGDDNDQGGMVPQGESTSGAKDAILEKVFSNTPKVIYLGHDFEDGELVENWTRDSMLEALGLKDENLKFDIEDEIPTARDSEYVFKFVEDADDFNDVIVQDDSSDSDQDVPFHYAEQDDNFPTFAELFCTHNEDDLRRKVAEKISTEGPPKDTIKGRT
ncbi:hypothetical protein Hanom_Chr04g00318541 [Helianthus anomalus]